MRKVLSIIVIVSIIGCSFIAFSGCSGSGTGIFTGAGGQEKLPPSGMNYTVIGNVKGIDNFVVEYDNRLMRGGALLSRSGTKFLTDRGVNTVIALKPTEWEAALLYAANINLIELPVYEGKAIPDDTLRGFFEAFDQSRNPVYLRADADSHYAGAFGMAYRMYRCQWPYEDALIEFGRLGGNLKDDHEVVESIRTFKE